MGTTSRPRSISRCKRDADPFDLACAEADPRRRSRRSRRMPADPRLHPSDRRSKRDANPDDFDLAEAEADPRLRLQADPRLHLNDRTRTGQEVQILEGLKPLQAAVSYYRG